MCVRAAVCVICCLEVQKVAFYYALLA